MAAIFTALCKASNTARHATNWFQLVKNLGTNSNLLIQPTEIADPLRYCVIGCRPLCGMLSRPPSTIARGTITNGNTELMARPMTPNSETPR